MQIPRWPIVPFSTVTCSASFRLFAWFLSVSRVFCVGSLERWDSQEWPVATCTSESESWLGSAWTAGLRADHPVSLVFILFFSFIFEARGLRVGVGPYFCDVLIADWWGGFCPGPQDLLRLSPDKQGLFVSHQSRH